MDATSKRGGFRRSPFPGRLAALAVALVAAACSPDRADRSPAADADSGSTPEASIPVEVRDSVEAIGAGAARELATTLIGRLQKVLEAEGAAGAVAFCSAEGLPLTAEVSREAGFDVKRTSSRVRNPANAPDSLERTALARFAAAAAAGDSLLPARLVQRTPAGDYRYYQPLRIQPLCVQCHGPADELADGVAEILARRYPEDAATGYEVGDFRGLIRVTVPAAAVAGQGREPDYAALLPVIVDYADEEMVVYDGPPIPAAVHMGRYIALVRRETGEELNAAAIAREFAGHDRGVSDRATSTKCGEGPYCEYVAPEELVVEVEELSRVQDGLRVVVRVLFDTRNGTWEENRFLYDFAWQGDEWIRTGRDVLTRS